MEKFTIRADDQTFEVTAAVSSRDEMIYTVTIGDAELVFKAGEHGELVALETNQTYVPHLIEEIARQIESHCL